MARRCRTAKGQFKRCPGKRGKRSKRGLGDLGAVRKGRKGTCKKWSRGRTKCLRRAKR